MELMHASNQWFSRPADQRFTSLIDLQAKCKDMRDKAHQTVVSSRKIHIDVHPTEEKGLIVDLGNEGGVFTNWSFGQAASLARAPAGYLKLLHPTLIADNLNYGLRFLRDSEDVRLLTHDFRGDVDKGISPTENGALQLSAATGPNYGRIWNSEVLDTLVKNFGDGISGDWRVPGEFGKKIEVTKENTTLYGSDRDIFVFLADETNRIDVPNRRNGQSGSMARGWFLSNSEVGDGSLYMGFFLFDYACSNRIVWGAQDFKEIRIRHTARAPDRWLEEIMPVLNSYAESEAKGVEETIKAAQEAKLKSDVEDFLKNRKFTEAQITGIKRAHEDEEGRPMETLWDVTTGVTAFAKSIRNNDDRVNVERNAGRILDLVAA